MDSHATHLSDRQAFFARADPLIAILRPSVRPLLVNRGNRAPDPIGSAVLLRVGSARFLLTAAHVLDDFGDEPLLVGGEQGMLPAPGTSQRSRATTPASVDMLDVAALRLDPGYLDELESHFLGLDDVDLADVSSQASNYLLIGFRSKAIKVDARSRRVEFDSFRYGDGIADAITYKKNGLDPQIHVVLNYARNEVEGESGRMTEPRPKGVSGGGIWHVPSTVDAAAHSQDKLVAVFTDHDRQAGILRGTRIAYHLQLIRRRWSDVADDISSRFHRLGILAS